MMAGTNISNAANNLIHTQTLLVFASEPMALLFFCIHIIDKVQHT